ncbi:hypothetical protein WJX73_007273 [Symbiochloris irregularis]|uniref:Uncharacterized protein n=1 Tax=Symbiochloris irregularis TaxID=706552 RepID=A0AAW1NSU9_9CHLO
MSPDDQCKELLKPDSAAIKCIVAAAVPELYLHDNLPPASPLHESPPSLQDYQDSRYPPVELNVGLAGRINYELHGSRAFVDTGLLAPDPGQLAVAQLGINLNAVSWLIKAAHKYSITDTSLVGRMCVLQGASVSTDLQQIAEERWNYELCIQTY